jgi:hypothetical protein
MLEYSGYTQAREMCREDGRPSGTIVARVLMLTQARRRSVESERAIAKIAP